MFANNSKSTYTIDECFHLFINEENYKLYTNKKVEMSVPLNKKRKPVDRTEYMPFLDFCCLLGDSGSHRNLNIIYRKKTKLFHAGIMWQL